MVHHQVLTWSTGPWTSEWRCKGEAGQVFQGKGGKAEDMEQSNREWDQWSLGSPDPGLCVGPHGPAQGFFIWYLINNQEIVEKPHYRAVSLTWRKGDKFPIFLSCCHQHPSQCVQDVQQTTQNWAAHPCPMKIYPFYSASKTDSIFMF